MAWLIKDDEELPESKWRQHQEDRNKSVLVACEDYFLADLADFSADYRESCSALISANLRIDLRISARNLKVK